MKVYLAIKLSEAYWDTDHIKGIFSSEEEAKKHGDYVEGYELDEVDQN